MRPEGMATARYLGPCLTPAQVDAAVRAEREACAVQCNDMGAEEQHNFGLGRAAQNYYRARDAIRARGTTDAGDTK
ncbi:hypothetical protein HMPREF9946_03092 [Acetobacteraceae bacterium AT-5844]|nr:hypothetical protein HMPREF9946_03092 [Acetobacteraceae bacterium AT-5844]